MSNHVSAGPDAQYIAEMYFAAQQSRTHFADILKINPELDDVFLYDVQKRFVTIQQEHGAIIGGYKGGFIPKAPIGGVLFQQGFLVGTPSLETKEFQGLLIEAEIAFQVCQPVTTPIADVSALRSLVCKVRPAIELPDAALANLGALRKDFPHLRRLLIPTNMAASHLLLGEGRDPRGLDLDRIDVRIEHNGSEIGFRPGVSSTDDIWQRVLWVVNEFVLGNGYELTPDHVIIPGALTGLHPGKPGSYTVDYGLLGNVTFQLR